MRINTKLLLKTIDKISLYTIQIGIDKKSLLPKLCYIFCNAKISFTKQDILLQNQMSFHFFMGCVKNYGQAWILNMKGPFLVGKYRIASVSLIT